MTDDVCEICITAPDPDWLAEFSTQLVIDGLCACAHQFSPIRAIYRWDGELQDTAETRVALHTTRNRVPDIIALAKGAHPYQVPAIFVLPILDGSLDYLDWIREQSTPPTSA